MALIREIVLGRSFPTFDVASEADEREAAADRLTQEQAALLKVTRLITRMEVRGGAGSGKTILALTQAKDLTRGQGERRPQRVALLCYSIGLEPVLQAPARHRDRHHRPAFVGNFEDLARHWGITEFARPRRQRLLGAPPARADARHRGRAAGEQDASTPSSSTRPRTSPTTGGTRS